METTTTTLTRRPDEIRARRTRVGLTQVQLAIRAETSLTTVSKFEAGLIPAGRSSALARVLAVLGEAEKNDSPADVNREAVSKLAGVDGHHAGYTE